MSIKAIFSKNFLQMHKNLSCSIAKNNAHNRKFAKQKKNCFRKTLQKVMAILFLYVDIDDLDVF